MTRDFTQCSPCGRYFTGLKAFDKHRVGRHEPLERRCLSEFEMREKGMTQDAKGRWGTGEKMSEADVARVAALPRRK